MNATKKEGGGAGGREGECPRDSLASSLQAVRCSGGKEKIRTKRKEDHSTSQSRGIWKKEMGRKLPRGRFMEKIRY